MRKVLLVLEYIANEFVPQIVGTAFASVPIEHSEIGCLLEHDGDSVLVVLPDYSLVGAGGVAAHSSMRFVREPSRFVFWKIHWELGEDVRVRVHGVLDLSRAHIEMLRG